MLRILEIVASQHCFKGHPSFIYLFWKLKGPTSFSMKIDFKCVWLGWKIREGVRKWGRENVIGGYLVEREKCDRKW